MRQTLSELRESARAQLHEWAQVMRNAGWLVAERVLRLVIGLTVSVALARHLGPSGMGEFGLALGWAALLTPLATFCLDDVIVRELVAKPERRGQVLGTALCLRGVAGLGCMLLGALAVWVAYGDVGRTELVAVVTLTALWGAADVFTLWFQHKTQMQSVVRLRSLIFIVLAAVRLLFVKLEASLLWFAVLVAVETAMCALVALWLFMQDPSRPRRFEFSGELARLFLRQGFPLMLSGVAVATYLRVDQVLLPWWAGDHEAGLYAVALRISEAWYVIPTALTQSALPRVVAKGHFASSNIVQELSTVFRTLVLVAYGVAIGLSVAAPWLVHTLFGSSYEGAAAVLVVHVWAGVFVALGTARSIWDTATSRTHLSLLSVVCGAVVNLGLNALLIPPYGAVGAAAATLVAYAVATFVVHLIVPAGRDVATSMLRALVLMR